tara:strand:- start:682 stop:1428 length:747 start_codon:yes stop_codon:yes gene_type:complete
MNVILGLTPRCGSTSLAKSIRQSCKLHVAMEPFHDTLNRPRSYAMYRGHKQTRSLDSSFSIMSNDGYGCIKYLYYQLSPEENKTLLKMAESTIILYRKYFVDTMISRYMSTSFNNLTKLGWLGQKVDCDDRRYSEYVVNKKIYDSLERSPLLIDNIKRKYLVAQHSFTSLKQDLQENVMLMEYDSLYNTEEVYNIFPRIVSFLGYRTYNDEWRGIMSPHNKFNSHDVYKRVIPNYEELMNCRDEFIIE